MDMSDKTNRDTSILLKRLILDPVFVVAIRIAPRRQEIFGRCTLAEFMKMLAIAHEQQLHVFYAQLCIIC